MPTAIVVGQGAAGFTAALTLAKEGIKVVSIGKTRPGTATCTIYAGGGFTLPVEGMSSDEHYALTYGTGRQMNDPELLDVFSSNARSIVDFLKRAAVPFDLRRGGLGLKRSQGFPLLGGKALTDTLFQACVNEGVEFLSNLAVNRILTNEHGASGVECIDCSSGRSIALGADVVVLAAGGGGALYKRTDNPKRITGDGYRLALDVGCQLSDMEFVQFYPTGFDIPGGSHWFIDLGILDIARATAPDGREFLKELFAEKGISSGREANLLLRDMCSVAIAKQNQTGQCLLHTEDVSKDVWLKRFPGIVRMFPASSPPWSAPVSLGPIQHYFPGGVVIGGEGETEVPGLFACGEVTGGVDGANRVGGNALTNCVLFGIRSALAASRHAKGEKVDSLKSPDSEPVDHGLVEFPKSRSSDEWLRSWKDGSISPGSLRGMLKDVSERFLTPFRTGDNLRFAETKIRSLMGLLEDQVVENSRDLLLATENLGLWYTAATVLKGAIVRQESRGAHYRADFPDEEKDWKRPIYIGKRSGSLAPGLGKMWPDRSLDS